MYEKFSNKFYGDYGCSRCGKTLKGWCNCVGVYDDEDGLEWRSFCDECWPNITGTPDEIYNQYPDAPMVE